MEKKQQQKCLNLVTCVIIPVLACAAVIGGCSYINRKMGLKDDHFLEESAEKYIENQTGLDIDLTPESKEHS